MKFKKREKKVDETKTKTNFFCRRADFFNSLKINRLENNALIFSKLSPPPPEPGIT